MVNGYDTEILQDPKIVSYGEWWITGDKYCGEYWPLKRSSALTSGLWGVSGVHSVTNYAEPYDDISGVSGAIGVSLTRMLKDSNTGMTNINRPNFRRAIDVLHFGVTKMPYISGTLDGTVCTLTFGDKLAPCPSGFRVWEQINTVDVTGHSDTVPVLGTGYRQQEFAIYMDTPSNITGTTGLAMKKVFVNPFAIYGVHK